MPQDEANLGSDASWCCKLDCPVSLTNSDNSIEIMRACQQSLGDGCFTALLTRLHFSTHVLQPNHRDHVSLPAIVFSIARRMRPQHDNAQRQHMLGSAASSAKGWDQWSTTKASMLFVAVTKEVWREFLPVSKRRQQTHLFSELEYS